MHACIYYFLLDVRANQCGCAWVPWSIDSFEKYSNFVHNILYMHNIISSTNVSAIFFWMFGRTSPAIRANQCGCAWVPRSIDSFLRKSAKSGEEYLHILYIRNIISCTDVSTIFFWMFGEPEPVWLCVSSLKYRFLRKILMHGTRANQCGCAWVPWSIDSFEKYSNFYFTCIILYMHNIISSTHVSAIFFGMFGRTSPAIREFPEV